MADNGNAVELRGVVKRFDDFVALRRADLDVPEGSFVTFLGPSGCGKTTTLRMIAGLLDPSEGDILVKGRRINDVPIHRRNLGLVFQNYALFPHKSIFDNVAFGLKYRRVSRSEVTRRVREALALVRLPDVEERLPIQLSGGQQQRIALARAIVFEPDVLLLDEPLSALDANLREEMRIELKRIQRELGIATIFVTHDQSEALAMSDKVVVMNHGVIEQEGTPEAVYNEPATAFVADFLGHSNILPARVRGREGDYYRVALEDTGMEILTAAGNAGPLETGAPVRLVLRAERLRLGDGHEHRDGDTLLNARVDTVDYQGQLARYFLSVAGMQLQAINAIDRRPFAEGATVQVRVRGDDCVILHGHGD
ncbi:ABC transporter ATP-binding protein [Arhodomonas aquaeolei]|uniref:ABC transporter ATP-binding protein n=1 Tax=Arhodomonas aquaeolei TaxID=2369 RepID=UPI000374B6E0|nr:ABC transporter ATP-binding protein [Arhodomonas aquaeolei]